MVYIYNTVVLQSTATGASALPSQSPPQQLTGCKRRCTYIILAEDLDHVIYRMGLLAVLRSKCKKATIGVMITASHNPEEDNGVKLVDPHGEMLEREWEGHATTLANVSDAEISATLSAIVSSAAIDTSVNANVVFARDTRPSSISLSAALQDGIEALGGTFKDYGLLTTPQLHYMVLCINSNHKYGQPNEHGYYDKLSQAFKSLRGEEDAKEHYVPRVVLDGANGVGAIKMREMNKQLDGSLSLDVHNDGSSGKLNYQCGADYVKVQQKGPTGIGMEPGVRYASFDGDADRIVFYFHQADGTFRLLDGDKIATLIAGYLQELVTDSGLSLNLGLVQTAYANGSSTRYITHELKVPVACVPTGVKYLHHKAQSFDIGVYFEANGHGTVLFSEAALSKIAEAKSDSSLTTTQQQSARTLANVVGVINQTVGDAISDLLLVETVLHARGWGVEDWHAQYTDLPNRQLKVRVKDRTVIETTDAERQTTSPPGLQEAINAIVADYSSGRSFVRPSGTEDVVRVYSEADTQEGADRLGHAVSLKVYELAGGVGDPPKPLS